ncbi:MAG: hypothetical protein AAB225_04675, partial [Acidobacteriota bacterium]
MPRAVPLRSLYLCVAGLAVQVQAQAPVPGPNVNIVSGTTWPGGDPFLQRQNEPSIAVSTRNPQHVLAGANDYRSVDIPFPEDSGRVIGDAWVGVFKSLDGGQTWRSALLPGFPQDNTSAESQSSPLRNFKVATDPTVRAGTNGLFYYSGLVFGRGNNAPSGVFVARYQDLNDREYNDPIKYLGAAVVDNGTSGVFLDKPWLAVDIPRGGAICGNVYLTYSVFTGTDPGEHENNPRSKIMFLRSTNCGVSWQQPLKLSETFSLNQGTTLAIDPRNGAVYVAWRQMESKSQSDGLVVVKSVDGGLTFGKAVQAFTFSHDVLFDQRINPTTSFRTLALPSLAADAGGRVYMVWPQRVGGPTGPARIMMATSPDGTNWTTTPQVAETGAFPGHQFMPSLTFAAGKLTLAFYDSRDDHKRLVRYPGQPETMEWMGPDSETAVFNSYISDAGLKTRHTIDVRLAQASPGANPNFGSSVRVSQYKFGSRPLLPGQPPSSRPIEQLQFNPPNLPMFVQGTRPFIGDYIDIAALAFVVGTDGKWAYNTSSSGPSALHVVWTDNRDVRTPPIDPATGKPDWRLYTPPNAPPGTPAGTYDPNNPRPACVAAQTGSRNQNIYTSRITPGLYVALGGNSKQLSSSLKRGFPVIVRNNTALTKSYRLSIANQPAGGTASFSQTLPLLAQVDVTIPPRSSISRTVWVTSSERRARVTVDVKEIEAPGAASPLPNGLQGSVVANPDISNPDISNPDISNPDISNPDISNPDISNPDITGAEVYNPTVSNPDISNPDISNPDISNPDISNPDISNPDIANPDISTMVVANPDISNPDISNPDIANPDIANPDISNPDIAALTSGGATDLTWKLTNTGNTSASYSAKLFLKKASFCCPQPCPSTGCPAGCFKCQLILRRVYPTPIASGCELKVETQNVAVANILNPAFATPLNVSNPDISNPDITNATVSLSPGEGTRVTLRVFGTTLPPRSASPPGAKPVGLSNGANTGESQPAGSLTIISVALPVAVAGKPYEVDLRSIGGKGLTRTWTRLSGSLPPGSPGLTLDSATGRIWGTPTEPGPYDFKVQVQDSPTPPTLPQIDKQDLTIEVNRLSITSVSAFQSGIPGDTILKEGESVTVNVTVENAGPATATEVTPALTVISTGVSGCTGTSLAAATIAGGNSQVFTYTCGPVSGEGTLTFTATASGKYVNSAATVTETAGPVLSNPVVVDKTPPVLSVTANVGGNPYTAGAWTNKDVAVTFTCTDNPGSGVAPGNPTGSTTLTEETSAAGVSVTGNCVDNAGNSATPRTFGPVKVDKTPPVISGSRTPGPNAAGWNNTDVTVTFSCTDALS